VSPTVDQQRTARLLFDRELTANEVEERELQAHLVRSATRVRSVPSRPVRAAQQVLYKLGGLSVERSVVGPQLRARATVLGERAPAPPRFLVRVDEFPHYRAWDDPKRFGTSAFERFHEVMTAAGVPYLLAVSPRVSREPLSPANLGSRPLDDGEAATLKRLTAGRVAFGLHGRDHRTRHVSPRRRSELGGLTSAQTEQLVERALVELAPCGIRPGVFVPPYNRFDADQLRLLGRSFDIVCGGPESIGSIGFQRPPQWRDGTVYLPSYAPFYGPAADVLRPAEHAIEHSIGLWVPIVLHWGWEWEAKERLRELERLVALIAAYAAPWEDFLAAIARSRQSPHATTPDRTAPAIEESPAPRGDS
jgi:hypothetical protein